MATHEIDWRQMADYHGLLLDTKDAVHTESNDRSRTGLFDAVMAFFAFAYVFCAVGLQGVPTASRSALLCAICLWIVLLEGIRTRRILLEGWLFYPLVFLAYIMLCALRAEVLPVSTLSQAVSAWGGAVGMGVAIRNGVSWRVPVYSMILAGVVSVVAHLLGINAVVWAENYQSEISLRRATGLIGNANGFSILLGLPAFLVFLGRREFPLIVKGLCLFLAVYGAIICGSRKGAALALCLLTYTLLAAALKSRRFRYVYLIVIAGAVLVILPIAVNAALANAGDAVLVKRVSLIFEGGGSSIGGRKELIEKGYTLFWSHPFTGHGLDTFRHLSGLGVYAHNNFVELAVNGGVIGLILFYAMHYKALVYSISLPRAERGWLWALVAYTLLQDLAVVSYLGKTPILVLMMLLARAYPSRDWKLRDILHHV